MDYSASSDSSPHDQRSPEAWLALLQWYQQQGVDEAVSSTPHDYRKPAPQAAPAPQQTAPPPLKHDAHTSRKDTTPSSLEDVIHAAKQAAMAAKSFDALCEAIETFDGCSLKRTAMHTVIYDGQPNADILVIGEAPGADEDRRGIPFCGVSGQLLDQVFASIGLSRETNVLISNMIYWRPPGNRNPTADELAICRPFVERMIALVEPKMLLLVGGIAAKALLNTKSGITRLRGKAHHYHCPYAHQDIPAYALLHPSYLLRQPLQKRAAWQDMLMLAQLLPDMGINGA